MFKIARTVKQIYNAARNIPKAASASINSSFKYNSQSKGYAEDASQESKEYVDAVVATYSIADEFNAFREQGYDFAGAWKAIENQNINKTLSERMKELVVSGYISRYGGESGLKEEVEELRDKHVLVIKEFMQKVQSIDNSVLLVDSENDEAVTDDVTKADLLGEY